MTRYPELAGKRRRVDTSVLIEPSAEAVSMWFGRFPDEIDAFSSPLTPQGGAMSNLDTLRALFATYANKDLDTVRSMMSDGIVWRIPEHHPFAEPRL